MQQNAGELIRRYLTQGQMMQVATVRGHQPWVCTVYYIEDDDLNLYWLSLPERRHSQDIESNNKIAVAVPIKFNKPVIGIQAEGAAEAVGDREVVEAVMARYVQRHHSGRDFHTNFVARKNKHQLYKFAPSAYYLFDEVTYGDGRSREWKPEA